MSRALIAALCMTIAAPTVVAFAPANADAQVLAGRYAARATPHTRRPALSAREEERLYAAQDEVFNLQQEIETLQAGAATTPLTAEQQAQLEAHQARLAEQQAIVDRLEAKRDRRGG